MTTERRWALGFGALSMAAFALFVWAGRNGWFFLDEWDFLGHRQAGSTSDLFAPHNEHWSTLPIVVYRSLYVLVGLRSYVPYQVVVICLHIGAAWLVRAVMVRSGVRLPIATAAAGLFLLLGSGFQNILWAFQIGFTGSLVASLGFLVLVDHDGPLGRRDVAGSLLGLAGLMSSGVSVPLTAGVGLALLLRRGWRVAVAHLAPLALAYLVWFGAAGRTGYTDGETDLVAALRFAAEGLRTALLGMGQYITVAVALGALLGVAIAMIGRRLPRSRSLPGEWAAPIGLAAGGLAFMVVSGLGRAATVGVDSASASRYVHLLAATLLPIMALAGSHLAARVGSGGVVAVTVLFLLGVPGNVIEVTKQDLFEEKLLSGNQPLIEAMVASDLLAGMDPEVEVSSLVVGFPTVEFLEELRVDDKLGEFASPGPLTEALARTHLSFRQVAGTEVQACRAVDGPIVALRVGEGLIADGEDVEFRLAGPGASGGAFVRIDPVSEGIVATRDSIAVEVRSLSGLDPAVLRCQPG